MTEPAKRKEESRARILASAGRGFRCRGFGGLGVDELANQAGVTSGAFYAHFKSKAAAFRQAVAAGLDDLRDGIEQLRRTEGETWLRTFVSFYMGERRRADLPQSCALQSLAADVARGDAEVRQVFESKLREIVRAVAGPGEAPLDRARAIALLALMSGGVSMTRAVEDPALREEIAQAVEEAAVRLADA